MAIIGIVMFILYSVFGNIAKDVEYHYTTFTFSWFILFWSIMFVENWKWKQALFAMRYGQINIQENLDNVRSGFKGKYIWNPSDYDMNILYYSKTKWFFKYMLTFTISLIIIIASVATSLAILWWKKSIDPADQAANLGVIIINTI